VQGSTGASQCKSGEGPWIRVATDSAHGLRWGKRRIDSNVEALVEVQGAAGPHVQGL
jgi:hypothetical protein